MKFKSRNSSIVSVSGSRVTGVNAGDTYVDVYKDNEEKDYRGAIHVVVKPYPSQGDVVHVETFRPKNGKSKITVTDVGRSKTIEMEILPEDATDKTITWTSSNPNVISCVNGVIKFIGGKEDGGTYTVTATCDGQEFMFTVQVNIFGTYVKRIYTYDRKDNAGNIVAKKLPSPSEGKVPQTGDKYCIAIEKEILGSTDYGAVVNVKQPVYAIKTNVEAGKGIINEVYDFTLLENKTSKDVESYFYARGTYEVEEKRLNFIMNKCTSPTGFRHQISAGALEAFALFNSNGTEVGTVLDDNGYRINSGCPIEFCCSEETYDYIVDNAYVDKQDEWIVLNKSSRWYEHDTRSNYGFLYLTVEPNQTEVDGVIVKGKKRHGLVRFKDTSLVFHIYQNGSDSWRFTSYDKPGE